MSIGFAHVIIPTSSALRRKAPKESMNMIRLYPILMFLHGVVNIKRYQVLWER